MFYQCFGSFHLVSVTMTDAHVLKIGFRQALEEEESGKEECQKGTCFEEITHAEYESLTSSSQSSLAEAHKFSTMQEPQPQSPLKKAASPPASARNITPKGKSQLAIFEFSPNKHCLTPNGTVYVGESACRTLINSKFSSISG